MVLAKAQAKLITVKPAADRVNKTRVDSRRDKKADSGIMMISPIRYEVCTQLISSALAESPA